MSSRQSDTIVKVEFFTTTHRITGEVDTGPRPLSDVLNNKTQSYLAVFNVYVSRLAEPGKIGAHAPVAFLSKDNLSFVIVPSRESRAPDHGRFSAHVYDALATLPDFEVRGKFSGPQRLDLHSFSPAALDAYLVMSDATAQLADDPEAIFSGEVILINRTRLESLNLSE